MDMVAAQRESPSSHNHDLMRRFGPCPAFNQSGDEYTVDRVGVADSTPGARARSRLWDRTAVRTINITVTLDSREIAEIVQKFIERHGLDTVPAFLAPGEGVLNKPQLDAINVVRAQLGLSPRSGLAD